MLRRASLLAALLLSTSIAEAGKRRDPNYVDQSEPTIKLNGELVNVRWSDGDSFKIKSGKYKGKGTRLQGFNTLEAYGPVHRWGGWTWSELYDLASRSSSLVEDETWNCTTDGKVDGYNRILVSCPDAAKKLIREGHAFVLTVGDEADPALLKVQAEAQKKKAGMWAKGVPPRIITSVHSIVEGEDKGYNRVVDTRTGKSEEMRHEEAYGTCQQVCVGEGDGRSCMVYVPFRQRYGPEQPPCLTEGGPRDPLEPQEE
ncbi:MAG: thermonuclease family protein [Myxococcales bacterium]